jgi:tetratricopeptide (TPR) repeat protein
MPPIDPTQGLPPFSEGPVPHAPTHEATQATTKPAEPVPLPETIGPYKILGVLGSGGMGVVYRAEQDRPRREVAVKVMKPGSSSAEHLHRFRHEADALARLQHDGIARIYGAGTVGSGPEAQPYLVMELIDGRSLTTYAEDHKLGTAQRLELMVRVCDAVQHAHYQGVVHRDLKPANILVGKDGRPKVLDFGVALFTETDRREQSVQTAVGQLIGTMQYMSPEQAEGDPAQIDRRSDVYALGVICYQLLSGKLPHDVKGKAIPAAARILCEQEPASLSSVNRVFRGDLDAVVAKALARDKAARYQTADSLAGDLVRYLEGRPVEARPAGPLSRSWKFARRNKAFVSVAVLLLLAVTGGSWLGALSFLHRERAARLEADSIVQDARLAAQQGRWREALAKYDQALVTALYRDSVVVRLDRVRALLALNELDRCLGELEALAAAPDLGEQEGPVLLLYGDLLLGRDDARAEQLIERAKEKLPQAQAVYAEALLAEKSEVAVRLLQKALELDPSHQRCRVKLALLLLFLARFDAAAHQLDNHKILFPDDADAIVLRGLTLALQAEGKPARVKAALDALDRLDAPSPAADRAALRALAMFLAELRDPANVPDTTTGLHDFTRQWNDLHAELRRWQPGKIADGWEALLVPLRELTPFCRLPPRLRRGLERVLKASEDCYSNFGTAETLPSAIVADLNAAAATHPEGTVVYLQALAYFGTHQYPQADQVALRAVGTAALLPIGRSAFFLAAASESLLQTMAIELARKARAAEALLVIGRPAFLGAAAGHRVSLELRGALLRPAVNKLREMLALGTHRPQIPYLAVMLATAAKEYNLARQLLDDWEHDLSVDPSTPSPWLTLLAARARTERSAGAYGPAIQAADQFVRQVSLEVCSIVAQAHWQQATVAGPAPYLFGVVEAAARASPLHPTAAEITDLRKDALRMLQQQARDFDPDAPAKR